MAEYKIGYIDIYKYGRNDYLGGVLITDRLGMPVEFRHTETVSPSTVQQVLYGQALEKFLKCETLAKCLLGDLDNKPDILIVPDPDYFPLTRIFNFPFVQLGKANREPLKQHGDFVEISEVEIHIQLLTLRTPVRIRVDKKNAPTIPAIKGVFIDIGRTMDVLEPMARVQEALKVLVAEGS